ncbi:histidine kinase [Natronomonas sp. F2-12]|jgi:DICT domain-containing protein|uniref:Histidine kinase n=1 Tax=Natronomonas aquatica TaxID=2841590 RepID=A0A9R1D679_9EURY|nr:DICT sensory domain-containing protein [Natronomonas aquatica]MCQ4333058.1 histidine kinase [Natronomonas aquatica]
MSLQDGIEQIRQLEKELVLFNIDSSDPLAERLTTYFAAQNVNVSMSQTASRQPPIAILSNNTEVLSRVDIETLRKFVDHSPARSETIGVADGEYEAVLGYLKETTFTSYDTEQMLYASREIEDRARRVGSGTVHAGFQRCSILADQQAIYTDLAHRGLEVHAYGVPDTAPPELGRARVHAIDSDELAQTWFVVFDGGGDETQKSALLAEERGDDTFYGAWTYDGRIIDGVLEYLEATYLPVTNSRPRSES